MTGSNNIESGMEFLELCIDLGVCDRFLEECGCSSRHFKSLGSLSMAMLTFSCPIFFCFFLAGSGDESSDEEALLFILVAAALSSRVLPFNRLLLI